MKTFNGLEVDPQSLSSNPTRPVEPNPAETEPEPTVNSAAGPDNPVQANSAVEQRQVFDLKKYRLPSDFTEKVGGKVLSTVPARRPNDHVFFMVSPRDDYQVQVAGFEFKGGGAERKEKALLIVAPSMWQTPELASGIKPIHLFTAVDTFANVYIIPVVMSDNEWHKSMFEAMAHAQKEWIRIEAHKSLHGYQRTRAGSLLQGQEPVWPTLSFQELLTIAFKDMLIDNDQHIVLKKLRGEIN